MVKFIQPWKTFLSNIAPKIRENGIFVVTLINSLALKSNYGHLSLNYQNKPMFCVQCVNDDSSLELFTASTGKWTSEPTVDPYLMTEEFQQNGFTLLELVSYNAFKTRLPSIHLTDAETAISNIYYCAIFQKKGEIQTNNETDLQSIFLPVYNVSLLKLLYILFLFFQYLICLLFHKFLNSL